MMTQATTDDIAAEQGVRDLMRRYEAALRDKDLEALSACYADDAVIYDIGAQMNGFDALRALWEQCFPYFGQTIGTERKETAIHVSGDLAVVHGYTRLTGMDSDEPMARSWIRSTTCCRRVDGRWRVLHEHASFPVNCEEGKVQFILDE